MCTNFSVVAVKKTRTKVAMKTWRPKPQMAGSCCGCVVPVMTLSECQKGRVVKTTYQHFPLNDRPCQNTRWVLLTLCENSPFVSECIVALYRNGTLSALDGYIVTLEITAYAQHWHSDPERSAFDTDIYSKLNCGILTLNGTFSTRGCVDMQTGTFSP